MDRIPVELLQKILAYLDLKSLGNAVLICRGFWDTFKSAEEVITTEILLRQIDYDVLPEAILVNMTWNLGIPSISKGIEFAKNLRHRQLPTTKWRLATALPIANFHKKVRYLAYQAAFEALERQPRLARESSMPTRNEMRRFERALYRFQLYCNVVGRWSLPEQTELHDVFFKYFATWENEQLACVHEHFVRIVSLQRLEAFNFLVQHDISWGYLRIPYIDGHWSHYAQGILSRGLESIYQLSKAENYYECRHLLGRGGDKNGVPFCVRGFLSYGLQVGANSRIPPQVRLSQMSEEDKAGVCAKPFYEDPDPGPAAMWRWVYRDAEGKLVADPGMINHRGWAFPFWDLSRLQTAGLLGDPEIPGPLAPGDLGMERWRALENLNSLEESRRRRRQIRICGGTGFYDPRGKSKIKWETSDKIISGEILMVQPRSLEEARRYLNVCAKYPVKRPEAAVQDIPDLGEGYRP
ncbi:hypothetical protein O1611_g8029 [Lasiodiplodia mahajangana]|uniref:Uncharacterized protein n=1 Tax=Lasiodiplodia mahajangana TaxID=1108764 RepID=A0ACC2JDQ4_9PEZI|nr:hypothetical protein O1611_g8029 [Lasiodiplodia mahajangana]